MWYLGAGNMGHPEWESFENVILVLLAEMFHQSPKLEEANTADCLQRFLYFAKLD